MEGFVELAMSLTTTSVGTSQSTSRRSHSVTLKEVRAEFGGPSASFRQPLYFVVSPGCDERKIAEMNKAVDKGFAEAVLLPLASQKASAEANLANLSSASNLNDHQKSAQAAELNKRISELTAKLDHYVGTTAYHYYLESIAPRKPS